MKQMWDLITHRRSLAGPTLMITNVRTYGHSTGMCMHSHKLRATEIPVTADNMGWSWK